MFFLPVSRSEGEKMNWLWQKKKVGEEANFWNVHVQRKKNKKLQFTVYPLHTRYANMLRF